MHGKQHNTLPQSASRKEWGKSGGKCRAQVVGAEWRVVCVGGMCGWKCRSEVVGVKVGVEGW